MPTGATISYKYGTRIACGNPPGEIPVSGTPTWPYSNLMSTQMVTSRTLDLHDGSQPKVWTYLSSVGSGWAGSPNSGKVVVTDPLQNDTVHTFSLIGQSVCGPYETDTQYYSGSSPYNPLRHVGSGALLKEVSTIYTNTGLDNANPVNFSNYLSIGVLPSAVITTLASGVSRATLTDYDTFGFYQDYKGTVSRFSMGELRREKETDWFTGAFDPMHPPAAVRTTLNANLWEANGDYYAHNMVSLPCLRTVVTGDYSGAIPACGAIGTTPGQIAQTAYGYDETPQDKYTGIHGLQTSVTHWTGIDCTTVSIPNSCPVITKTAYDPAVNPWGMPSVTIDGRGNATAFTYDSTYLHLSQIDYPTTTTWAINAPHFEKFTYDPWTGLLLNKQDENGQPTTYKYDIMRRTTEVDFADGGSETYTYDDTAPPAYCEPSPVVACATPTQSPAPAFTFKKLISGTVGQYTAQGVVDQLGRNRRTLIVTSGAPILKDTFYDELGRVSSETNPFYTTTDDTYGVTSYTYDALGRKVKEVLPGGAARFWCYDGIADAAISPTLCHANQNTIWGAQWVDATDELNHATQNSVDGLGNLRAVYDPLGSSTRYLYDVLGNLTRVKQVGIAGETPRTFRNFTYDAMSRLVTSANPETGTICYGTWSGSNCVPAYDGNSNLISKTDARQIVTHYTYDEANRLVLKSYDNDPTVTAAACFQYDVTTLAPPISPPNLSGRLTNAWTQKAACNPHSSPPNFASAAGLLTRHSITAYDQMGRVLYEQQCTVTNCNSGGTAYTPSYIYDKAGNLTNYNNGIASGPGAMQFTTAYDIASRVLSVSRDPATPGGPSTNLFTAPAYTPAGSLASALYGTDLHLTRKYDSRLRIVGEMDTAGGTNTPHPATPGTATLKIYGQEQTH
jgi:YD repeat-containing protein